MNKLSLRGLINWLAPKKHNAQSWNDWFHQTGRAKILRETMERKGKPIPNSLKPRTNEKT